VAVCVKKSYFTWIVECNIVESRPQGNFL